MRKLHNKKSQATLTNPDELLDSPLVATEDGPEIVPAEEPELDEGPEPGEPSDSPPDELTQTPPEAPQAPPLQLPIALALPEQTRRVREQVLPAWYAHRYNPASPLANDPAVATLISDMNAALSAADHAMMTQDVGLMIFTYRVLERFQT